MSSKSKAVLAVCIVAGITGLIIIDLALSPKKTTATPTGNDSVQITTQDPAPPADPLISIPDEGSRIGVTELPRATQQTPAQETYVIKAGDSFESIARDKWARPDLWRAIADANPGVTAGRLRVGMTITLPPKPQEPQIRARQEHPTATGSKVHTIQPGETLEKISKQYYRTGAHFMKIFDANKELLRKPDALLRVGWQIVIPALDAPPASPSDTVVVPPPAAGSETPVPAAPTPAPAGPRKHKVAQGESLWKIAAKYSPRNVPDMIEKIIEANPEKLRSEETMLRVGWELVIPD